MEQAGVQLVAQGASAFGADMKDATKAVDSFGAETKKAADLIQDASGRWRTASGRFASDAEKAAAGVATVTPAAKGAGDAAKQAGDDAEKGGRGFDAFGEIVTGALRKVGEMAVDAFAEAAKATAVFLKDSVGLAGDFEAGMLEFQAVAGKDVDTKGLDKFHDLFLQLGKELPVSTSEVEQAAIEMVKGGIDPAIVAAGGLRQNIQFAAAAMDGDLVEAANVSAKILGGWADANATATEKADFLTHATDQLTKAANASSVDVHELSLGIFNAQGIAKTAGVSFDDLTTTLAALSPRFASSSEAGNSLKNVIARLQPTTKAATGAMEGLGLITADGTNKFYDAQGSFIGFEKASQLLQDSLKGLTDQQKQAVLQTIFGNDAMNAASGLAELGASGYQHMADALAGANGVAENAALKQQGYNTALENAKGSVEALQITIGEALLPVLTDLLNNVVAPAINTFTDIADAVFGSNEAFQRLSPTLQDIVTTIDTIVMNMQNIIGAFDDAGAGSVEFGQTIGELVDDLGGPGDLITDIVFAVQDLVAWFGQAGSETNALDTVLVDLSDTFDNVLYTVQDVAAGYQHIAQAVLPIVAQLWDDHGAEITAFLKETYDSIIEIVNLALEVYDSIVPPVLNAIAGFFEAHGSEIEKILTGAGEAIGAIVTGTMETIKGVFHLALDLIHGDWDAVWTDILGIGKAQITAIEGTVKGFLDMIAGLFDTSLADILQTWEDNWNMAVDIVSKIDWVAAGKSVVEGIIKGVKGMAGSLFASLEQMAQDAYDAFMAKIKGGSPAMEFVPAGQSMVQGIMLGLQNEMPALTDLVSGMGDDLISQVQDIGQEIQGAIADAFGATASIDRQIAKNFDKLGNIGDKFMQDFIQQSLDTEQKFAETFADPKAGAAYFKMVSDNIFETAALRKKIAETTDQDEKARLNAQLIAISRAQDAERDQFFANLKAQGSGLQDLIDKINSLFNNSKKADLEKQLAEAKTQAERDRIQALLNAASLPVNDTGPGHDLMMMLQQLEQFLGITPHLAQGGIAHAGQPHWVGEHGPELFWPGVTGTVSPAATSQQIASRGPVYNGQVGNTYNTTMPIYTNNSPGAIQQSWAIVQASMP